MTTPEAQLFSAAALVLLDRQFYDPKARSSYEYMSGGLMWPDESPPMGSPEWAAISPIGAYRYLIAYRASITLGEERMEFRPVWEQVMRYAPRWPGLCEERRGDRARHRLLAAQ